MGPTRMNLAVDNCCRMLYCNLYDYFDTHGRDNMSTQLGNKLWLGHDDINDDLQICADADHMGVAAINILLKPTRRILISVNTSSNHLFGDGTLAHWMPRRPWAEHMDVDQTASVATYVALLHNTISATYPDSIIEITPVDGPTKISVIDMAGHTVPSLVSIEEVCREIIHQIYTHCELWICVYAR